MTFDLDRLPTYEQLRFRKDGPPGSSWYVFGKDDELGTVNFLTPERVLAARASIRTGATFGLDYPLDQFPGPVRFRPVPKHTITTIGPLPDGTWGILEAGKIPAGYKPHVYDDYIDGLFMQGATQIDGLRHHAHFDHGFYNGFPLEAIRVGTSTLGIDRWANSGITGRGVLIDVAAFKESHGSRLDHRDSEPISPKMLDDTLRWQRTELKRGDIVALRTDFPAYLEEIGDNDALGFKGAGIEPSHAMISWLWDNQISMIVSDNLGVETMGSSRPSELGEGHKGRLHDILIPLFGMPLGELWRLNDLAAASRQDGNFDFFLTAKPLFQVGGVGTPANAIAIR